MDLEQGIVDLYDPSGRVVRRVTSQTQSGLIGKVLLENGKENLDQEPKEKPFLFFKNKILENVKKNGQDHHYVWFVNKIAQLESTGDKEGIEMLYKNFDFTKNKGLIINTPKGPLKFAPKQVSYDDIKDIDGIKENQNIWTENGKTGKSGLRANFEAVEKMQNMGHKILGHEQCLLAINSFPGGDILHKGNQSTKVKDFFDLLGVNQYGFRDHAGNWYKDPRVLCSLPIDDLRVHAMRCVGDKGSLTRDYKVSAYGVWFLEK